MAMPMTAFGAPARATRRLDARRQHLGETDDRDQRNQQQPEAHPRERGRRRRRVLAVVGATSARQEIVAMAHRLDEDEHRPHGERCDRPRTRAADTVYVAPGELVVNAGSTSDSVASVISAASAELAPSIRNVCSRWRSAPTSRQTPTTPLQMIMTVANTVSRGRAAWRRAARHHHRDDERHLDHGDRDREDERPERLANPMRNDLGVVDRRDDGADQRDGAGARKRRAERIHERGGEQRDRNDRYEP